MDPGDRVQAQGRSGVVIDIAEDWVTIAVDQCGHVTELLVPLAQVSQTGTSRP